MALPSISGVPPSIDQQDHVSFSLEVPKCPWSRASVRLPFSPSLLSRSLPSLLCSERETRDTSQTKTLERMEAGGDEDGEKEAAAAGAQELAGRVPQLEAPHIQPSSPHGRRSRHGSSEERGGGAGSPPGAGPISRHVVRGGRPRPAALAAARGAAGRPRPTARGAGRGAADAAGRARPPEHRPDRATDWAWRPPQAAVLVAQRPTRPTAREAAAVTTTRLAMPEPVVEKAPLPPKSEYCGSSFHQFRT